MATDAAVGQTRCQETGKGRGVIQGLESGQPAFAACTLCPGVPQGRKYLADQVLPEGGVGRVAGIGQAGQRVEAVARLDPDQAGTGAGIDRQLGGEGQLGARAAPGSPPPPSGPTRPGCRGFRAGRRPGVPGPRRRRRRSPAASGGRRGPARGSARRPATASGVSRSRVPPLKIKTPGPVQASMARANSVLAWLRAGVTSRVRCSSLTTRTRAPTSTWMAITSGMAVSLRDVLKAVASTNPLRLWTRAPMRPRTVSPGGTSAMFAGWRHVKGFTTLR